MKDVVKKGNWVKLYLAGTFAGKLRINDETQPGAYISHFEIKEKFRNDGNGSHLLQSAIEYALAKGCTAISLHCTVENVDALRFYKRHGFFIACSTYPKYDHYLMAKQIA